MTIGPTVSWSLHRPSCVFVSWEEQVLDFHPALNRFIQFTAKNAEDESLQLSYKEKNHLGEPVRSGGGAGVAPEAGGVAHQGQAQQSKQPHIRLSDNWN